MTPVAMLALDQFILWVPADAPYKTAKEYIEAVKAGDDKSFKMGGTGSKQEDQIITVALEKLTAPKKFTYVPYGGGGTVATQLVGKHVNSSVNNPIEAVSQWKAGALRPLCIFDAQRSTYKDKVTADMAWSDIPTCKEAGVDTQYQMLRGIFMAPGVKPEQTAFYVDLFKKVMATDDWKQFMQQGAFNQTFMSGDQYAKWVEAADKQHSRPDEGGGLPRARQVGERSGAGHAGPFRLTTSARDRADARQRRRRQPYPGNEPGHGHRGRHHPPGGLRHRDLRQHATRVQLARG